MSEFKKILESNMKIRFHDCDPFNHLNNSRYIDYFMTAREDQLLDNYDLDINAIVQQQGLGWVTAQTQISYLFPAQCAEEVLIQTRLLACSERSLLFEAVMYNTDKTVVKSVMWTKLVHFNLKTKQSHAHTESFISFLQKVQDPLTTAMSFDERVSMLKKQS